jgi:MFS family permease
MNANAEIQGLPLLTPQFALLLLATAIFGLSFSTYFLLPKFLAVELAADAVTIGGVGALSMLASVVTMPFIGVQVDRHGRKFFGFIGAALFSIASVGFLWVDSIGPLLLILRVLQGSAFTLFYVSLSTLATDISPAERLGQAIGMFGAVMISTNAIGPALAEWGAAEYGWSAVFGATVCAAVLSAGLTLFIWEKPRAHDRHNSTSMLQVLKRPGLQRVLIVAVMVGWSMGAMYTFYQPWALSRGIDQVSSYLIAFAICAMLVRAGLGGLADRLGRLRVATVALFFYMAAPFSLIWLDLFGLFLTGAFLGLAHGLFFPALNAVAIDCTLENERGKGMAAYHGAFNIGFAAGSYVLGYVAMLTSYPTIFAIAGVSCFAAFVLLTTVPRHIPGHHT